MDNELQLQHENAALLETKLSKVSPYSKYTSCAIFVGFQTCVSLGPRGSRPSSKQGETAAGRHGSGTGKLQDKGTASGGEGMLATVAEKRTQFDRFVSFFQELEEKLRSMELRISDHASREEELRRNLSKVCIEGY